MEHRAQTNVNVCVCAKKIVVPNSNLVEPFCTFYMAMFYGDDDDDVYVCV